MPVSNSKNTFLNSCTGLFQRSLSRYRWRQRMAQLL